MSTEKGPDHSWQQFGSTLDADPEHLELLAAAGCRRRFPYRTDAVVLLEASVG